MKYWLVASFLGLNIGMVAVANPDDGWIDYATYGYRPTEICYSLNQSITHLKTQKKFPPVRIPLCIQPGVGVERAAGGCLYEKGKYNKARNCLVYPEGQYFNIVTPKYKFLAASINIEPGRKPKRDSSINYIYQVIQNYEFGALFSEFNVTTNWALKIGKILQSHSLSNPVKFHSVIVGSIPDILSVRGYWIQKEEFKPLVPFLANYPYHVSNGPYEPEVVGSATAYDGQNDEYDIRLTLEPVSYQRQQD